MCRCRTGNPKRSSRFICLHCLDWKFTYIQGIQRPNQRELGHIKDNVCTHCGEVKTMEVRHCDYLPDIMKKAIGNTMRYIMTMLQKLKQIFMER